MLGFLRICVMFIKEFCYAQVVYVYVLCISVL